jgi:hypothetical protein
MLSFGAPVFSNAMQPDLPAEISGYPIIEITGDEAWAIYKGALRRGELRDYPLSVRYLESKDHLVFIDRELKVIFVLRLEV